MIYHDLWVSAPLHLILLLVQQNQTGCYVTGHQIRVLQHIYILRFLVSRDVPCHLIRNPVTPSCEGEDRRAKKGGAHRKEFAEELCDAGESGSFAFVLRQTAAEEPQPILPHLDGHGASFGEELGALAALQVAHSQGLHVARLRTGVAERVKHKQHPYCSKHQDDPTVARRKRKILGHNARLNNEVTDLYSTFQHTWQSLLR